MNLKTFKKPGAELLLVCCLSLIHFTLFTMASLPMTNPKCIKQTTATVAASSPGEWLNESEEASDREWREAALLALRVTGPSRTGGCGHTQRNTLVSIVSVMPRYQSAAGAPRGRRLSQSPEQTESAGMFQAELSRQTEN